MNNLLKILILEDDARDCEELQKYAASKENVSIIACTADSDRALELVKTENPVAVVVDLELHNGSGNGLLFLSSVKQAKLEHLPYLLVTTNNSSPTTHDAARALGADFILTKYESAYSAQYVIDFLVMMNATLRKQPVTQQTERVSKISNATSETTLKSNSTPPDVMSFIRDELHRIGINPKAVGFRYLTDAIWIKYENRDANIYSILGPKYNKSDPSIERSMQYAINAAWRTNNTEDLYNIYTARIHSDRGVPTILEFIFFYVSKVENFLEKK